MTYSVQLNVRYATQLSTPFLSMPKLLGGSGPFGGGATFGLKLSMGPMVTSRWKSKDYSAFAEESILLVGKSTGMPETTSGGFAPQTAGVDQMKLEAPTSYYSKRQPRVRVSLTQMELYMQLMRYTPTDWLDVVAMRVEGATSSWVNVVL